MCPYAPVPVAKRLLSGDQHKETTPQPRKPSRTSCSWPEAKSYSRTPEPSSVKWPTASVFPPGDHAKAWRLPGAWRLCTILPVSTSQTCTWPPGPPDARHVLFGDQSSKMGYSQVDRETVVMKART